MTRHRDKSQYAGEHEATKAVARAAKRHPAHIFAAYHCEKCGCWHIGRSGTTAEAERQRAAVEATKIDEGVLKLKTARGW